MEKGIRFFNTHAVILFSLALVLNLIYFLFLHGRTYESYRHIYIGDVAYSLYKSGSTKINLKRIGEAWKDRAPGVLGSYQELDAKGLYAESHDTFPSWRTIGYGYVIAGLWKLTGSLNFVDVQILQVLLYALFMFFIFQLVFMLFGSPSIAFICGIAHLLYLPLMYLNVQLTYDIWVYYGTVMLAYGFLRSIRGFSSIVPFLLSACFVSCCQFIRPHIFIAVLMFCLLSLICAFFHYCAMRRALAMIGCLLLTNVLFFWIPYVTFNMKTYGRVFAGPLGQVLIEGGLGQYDNPWGFKCDDGWFAHYMTDNYDVKYPTPECDSKARELFWKSVKQYPLAYVKNIFWRVSYCLFPRFNLHRPTDSKIKVGVFERLRIWTALDFKNKIVRLTELFPLLRVFGRLYNYLFMILFYLGLALAFARRNYLSILVLCLGVLFSSYYVIFMHIENRFILPYFWPVPIFAGYFVSENHIMRKWINRWLTQ